MIEDEYGRDPALLVSAAPVLLFPLTMISKRIEKGETVDVSELVSLWIGAAIERREAAT